MIELTQHEQLKLEAHRLAFEEARRQEAVHAIYVTARRPKPKGLWRLTEPASRIQHPESIQNMSARHFSEPLSPCACGLTPLNKIEVTGKYRRFKVACACGAETEWSEDYTDIAIHWNESMRKAAELRAEFPQ